MIHPSKNVPCGAEKDWALKKYEAPKICRAPKSAGPPESAGALALAKSTRPPWSQGRSYVRWNYSELVYCLLLVFVKLTCSLVKHSTIKKLNFLIHSEHKSFSLLWNHFNYIIQILLIAIFIWIKCPEYTIVYKIIYIYILNEFLLVCSNYQETRFN